MTNPLPNPQPPNAIEPHTGSQFTALNGKAVQLAGWSKTLTLWLKNSAVGPLVQNSNSQLTSINTLNGQVSTLQSQVTTLQSQVATLQSQVTTLQKQVATLNTEVATLTTEVNFLLAHLGITGEFKAIAASPYTIPVTPGWYLLAASDSASADFIANMPPAVAANIKNVVVVKKMTSNAHNIVVTPAGSDTIDTATGPHNIGAPLPNNGQYAAVSFLCIAAGQWVTF